MAGFLKQASAIAVIHVYTMGSYTYTEKVLDFLDPSLTLFSGKVLCRPERGGVFKKSIGHLPGFQEDTAWRRVMIVDDRIDAWDRPSQHHLLQLPAFHYFGVKGEGKSVDAALEDVIAVIRTVNDGLASGDKANVPIALKAAQQLVLRGCKFVFSGGILKDSRNPERCAEWAMAVSLGATCSLTFTDGITHVVSAKAATSSVARARAARLPVVGPLWLSDSALAWRRLPEQEYSL